MKRSARLATVAAVALLTAGTAAPALAGAPTDHGHHGSHGNPHNSDAVSAKDQRQVLRDLDHLDKRLAGVSKSSRLVQLNDADKAAVLANVTTDRADLAAQAETVRAADTTMDLKQVRRDLKQVRVSNYNEVINDLRFAERVTSKIETLRAQVTEGSVEATALDDAQAQVVEAVALAYTVNAHSPKDTLRAVKSGLAQAGDDADAVDDTVTEPTEPTVS